MRVKAVRDKLTSAMTTWQLTAWRHYTKLQQVRQHATAPRNLMPWRLATAREEMQGYNNDMVTG